MYFVTNKLSNCPIEQFSFRIDDQIEYARTDTLHIYRIRKHAHTAMNHHLLEVNTIRSKVQTRLAG